MIRISVFSNKFENVYILFDKLSYLESEFVILINARESLEHICIYTHI